MVLDAAILSADLPALLRESGHVDLARRWEQEAAIAGTAPWDSASSAVAGMPTPSDLRQEVLAAIEGTQAGAGLFSVPSVHDIGAALRATEAEALVYLVPGLEGRSGLAILVDSDATARVAPLPALRADDGPIETFRQCQRNLLTAAADDVASARQQWSSALTALCRWAWSAGIGPVLDNLVGTRPGRPGRVVLAPVGTLGAVPWHAACRAVPGGVRYAGQDAILSYAASARQFVDAARRQHRPWHAEPALVRVRASGLHWDTREMAEIRAHCYPGCTVLGAADDPVTPTAVTALLPGADDDDASVVHLSCHGEHAPVPVDSSLLLDDGSRLYVRDVLRHARGRRADASGGLVVLATCVSDLTDSAHDEALTLATTFLVAGGSGVVGARWPVADLPTALFMIMFHHYLNSGYPQPATALRATQLWMLDPDRRLPEGVDTKLAGPMRRAGLADVANWAAFTYQGH
ncbi:MAG TPA: CHAT domain-containing protein [Pseudonocardiaceae bacterium]|nr:CHAT domain-containing protein [Pseudonocardiaceae bacterium]